VLASVLLCLKNCKSKKFWLLPNVKKKKKILKHLYICYLLHTQMLLFVFNKLILVLKSTHYYNELNTKGLSRNYLLINTGPLRVNVCMYKPRNSYWRGSLSSVDLLILTNLEQLLLIMRTLLTFFTKWLHQRGGQTFWTFRAKVVFRVYTLNMWQHYWFCKRNIK
jgi:hypothetical protein